MGAAAIKSIVPALPGPRPFKVVLMRRFEHTIQALDLADAEAQMKRVVATHPEGHVKILTVYDPELHTKAPA